MASGDLKSEDCKVITVTAGATTVIGDFVHMESDGKWDPVTTGDTGKFAVALDAAVDTGTMRICIWGPVEVKATAAAIAKGAYVIAGTTGFVVDAGSIIETTVYGTIMGTAMTAFASSGQGIVWVGLVG